MHKLKRIKKMFKQQNLWNIYKHKFAHKQMKLLFSKITLIFVPDASVEWLYENEKKMLGQTKNSEMFKDVFMTISLINHDQYDWHAFGLFVWFIYQTSTFYQDQKHGIKNIFNKQNYVMQNAQKRHYYHLWLQSLDPTVDNYNILVKQVLQCVF